MKNTIDIVIKFDEKEAKQLKKSLYMPEIQHPSAATG